MRRKPSDDFRFEGLLFCSWVGDSLAADREEPWRSIEELNDQEVDEQHKFSNQPWDEVGRYFWGEWLAYLKRHAPAQKVAILHAHGFLAEPLTAIEQMLYSSEREEDRRVWYYEDAPGKRAPVQRWVSEREQEGFGIIVVLSCCDIGEKNPVLPFVTTTEAFLIPSLQIQSGARRMTMKDHTFFRVFAPGGTEVTDGDVGCTSDPPADVYLRRVVTWDGEENA